MATAGSQGKATAPPAGHARERPGAWKPYPRDRGTAHRRRAGGRGRGTRWRSPTYGQNPNLGGTPRPWGDSHAAGHRVSRLGRASERRMPAVPRAIPTGRASDQQMPCAAACRPAASSSAGPPRRRPVPVTTDALVGAHDRLRRRRPLAACTSATARRRARLHVGRTCLAPVAKSRCGCTPGSTMHGMPDPRPRTPALALVDPNRGAEARSAGERRDRVATYSSGSDKARASAHIASWCLRTGMLMKLRASSSSMRCCGVARNAFSLPMPSKK